MPVEQVTRAVAIDRLAICVSAYRYICDTCGDRDTFPDDPMPEGSSAADASRKGWRLYPGPDDDQCAKCPHCCRLSDEKVAARLALPALYPQERAP